MGDIFYWIGVAVVVIAGLGAVSCALLYLYIMLLHDRFDAILFRKAKRSLSLASWHQSQVIQNGHAPDERGWQADDYPICDRPFFLSYRVRDRRLFLMAGIMDERRFDSITGKHPNRKADQ